MKNIGNHTVRGVKPGGDIKVTDEADAITLARQGVVAWDDVLDNFIEREPKQRPEDDKPTTTPRKSTTKKGGKR